jgi:hypothetical protein
MVRCLKFFWHQTLKPSRPYSLHQMVRLANYAPMPPISAKYRFRTKGERPNTATHRPRLLPWNPSTGPATATTSMSPRALPPSERLHLPRRSPSASFPRSSRRNFPTRPPLDHADSLQYAARPRWLPPVHRSPAQGARPCPPPLYMPGFRPFPCSPTPPKAVAWLLSSLFFLNTQAE